MGERQGSPRTEKAGGDRRLFRRFAGRIGAGPGQEGLRDLRGADGTQQHGTDVRLAQHGEVEEEGGVGLERIDRNGEENHTQTRNLTGEFDEKSKQILFHLLTLGERTTKQLTPSRIT